MSQVTKPIALDETLQDVVTAIQGITQGGMIVSTGNVGSSTQPVYINGGVPTAGMNFGITTGTPTTSTNFTYDSSNSTVAKSGNVVQVRLKFIVSTAFTPTSNTVIATLPFKAFVNLTILPKALIISGTAYRGGTVVIRNTNQITFDTDARALSVGDSVYIWGTYLTND